MSIEELIQLLQNRLMFTAAERERAVARGDIPYIEALDRDATRTTASLTALQAAAAG